jgi:hypothetical protein
MKQEGSFQSRERILGICFGGNGIVVCCDVNEFYAQFVYFLDTF